jgi:hypothetical protein
LVLIVSGGLQAKLDRDLIRELVGRQQVTLVYVVAVGGVSVDVILRVELPQQTVSISTVAIATHNDHIVVAARPFALNTEQSRSQIEDEIVAFNRVGAPDADPELSCASGNFQSAAAPF